jgi:hypothetical protein
MDRQEALERSQSGEKPEGGYYTSSERISLRNFGLGRITRISSAKFTGSGGGRGGGGAIVPLSRAIDSSSLAPTTQSPQIDPNTISSLQKQINALVAKDEQQLSLNNNLVGTLQNQFQILQTRVIDLGKQLSEVNKSLTLDTNLEKTKEIQEKNLENRQREQQYRTDKESLIEKKITSALMAPIKMIGERVQFTLARVMQFLGILFTGWLVDKAIETFRAISEGNTKKLEDIKNSVLKNLGIVGGILLLLNGGFLRIAQKVAQLALKVGGFILANTIGRFFGSIVNAGKNMLMGGQKPSTSTPTSGATIASGASGGKPGAAPPTAAAPKKPNIVQRAAGAARGALKNLGGPLIQGTIGTGIDIAMGEEPGRAATGAAGGVTAGAVGAKFGSILGPVGALVGGIGGYALGSGFGKEQYDKIMGKPQPAATPAAPQPVATPSTPLTPTPVASTPPAAPILPTPTSNTSPSISPTVNMMPQSSDYSISPNNNSNEKDMDFSQPAQFGEVSIPVTGEEVPIQADKSQKELDYWKSESGYWDTIAKGLEAGSTYEQLGLNQQEIDYLEGKTETPPFLANEKNVATSTPAKLSPAQTQRIPSSTPPISPEPEAKPNVVYMSSGGGQPQMPKISESSGPASEVPSIPSGNPDNFYLLYSQVSYNVVM